MGFVELLAIVAVAHTGMQFPAMLQHEIDAPPRPPSPPPPKGCASPSTLSCSLTGVWYDAAAGGNNKLNETADGCYVFIASAAGTWTPVIGNLSGTTLLVQFSNAGGKVLTAEVDAGCDSIMWDNGNLWRAGPAPPPPPPPAAISTIHLVYMTHLDLGYTDTTRNVCDAYFNNFFPEALATAAELRKRNSTATFRWTEFPWLILEYLDGGAGCAHRERTAVEVAAMEAAIAQDDVIWHATALNFLPELLDEQMWSESLGLARDLNRKYNKTWGTVMGKHTDTPGMSRSAIPALADAGIQAYHIGYNAACAKNVAYLPPAFRWLDPSGVELLTMVNSNYGSEIEVPLSNSNNNNNSGGGGGGSHGGAPAKGAAGLRGSILHHGVAGAEGVALVFQFSVDNSGAPSADTVEKFWAGLRRTYPNADIKASSLDDFAAEVIAAANMSALPIVRGEIGDSWLYGGGADPIKLSVFREARRSLAAAIAAGVVDPLSGGYRRYLRRLMKGPAEHNWGLSIAHGNGDWMNGWDNAAFHKAMGTDADYKRHALEWAAQREWNHPCTAATAAAGKLPNTCPPDGLANATIGPRPSSELDPQWEAYVAELEKNLSALEQPATMLPNITEMGGPLSPGAVAAHVPVTCGPAAIAFSGIDGSIRSLTDITSGRQWVGSNGSDGNLGGTSGSGGSLATFGYQTYSDADFSHTYAREYTTSADFMKPGMGDGPGRANPVSGIWNASLVQGFFSRRNDTDGGCVFVMQLAMTDPTAVGSYGAPSNVSIEYTLPGTGGALVDISLIWTGKTPTRLAESMWLSFVPKPDTSARWSLDIMGHPVSPLEVVAGGTVHTHAVGGGVAVAVAGPRGAVDVLRVETLDASLVCPGSYNTSAGAGLLRYNNVQPQMAGGMHFNLENNLWGTSFPQWYGDDGIVRFRLHSSREDAEPRSFEY